MKKAWFVPRKFGIGFTPVSWQGWACVFAFILLFAGAVVAFS